MVGITTAPTQTAEDGEATSTVVKYAQTGTPSSSRRAQVCSAGQGFEPEAWRWAVGERDIGRRSPLPP